MSVALSIAFTGLCALISDGNGQPAQILPVDAKGIGEVGGVVLPTHSPTLVVRLRDLANPETSSPTRIVAVAANQSLDQPGVGFDGSPGAGAEIDQLGYWDLTGTEVKIRTQGGGRPGLRVFESPLGETSWPKLPRDVNDPAAWRDIRFVADLTALSGGGGIDAALLAEDAEVRGALPPQVASRIYLYSGLLEAGLPSERSYRDEVFEFRSGTTEQTIRQALTDTIHWMLQSEAAAVLIEIVPAAGGPAKRLLFAPSARPHRVFISNLPAENESHATVHQAMTDEEMSALHFGAYYRLLKDPPASMPLPILSQASSLQRGAGGIRPLFCPPARFTRN